MSISPIVGIPRDLYAAKDGEDPPVGCVRGSPVDCILAPWAESWLILGYYYSWVCLVVFFWDSF